MSDVLSRLARIETSLSYIKDSLDSLVELQQAHNELLRQAELNIVNLQNRMKAVEEKVATSPNPPSNTKIVGISATLAGIVISVIEYLKR